MAAWKAVMLFAVLVLAVIDGSNVHVIADKEKKEFLHQRGLKVLHQNIRGLLCNFCSLQEFVSSNQNIDVLTLTETHISSKENNGDLYKLSGYNFESRERQSGKGGGVGCYVKENVNYIRRKDLENKKLENIVIEILINNSKNVLIATHYKPPNNSKYLCHNFNDLFNESLSLYCSESKEVILLGDLNTDYLKKNDNKDVKSIIHQNGFTQIITKPTRITRDTKTLIDIIATNCPANIASSTVIPTSLSDHDAVACVRKINNKKFPKKVTRSRNYRSYDPEKLNEDLRRVDWNPVLSCPNVNDAVNIFNFILKSIFDKHAPYVTKRTKSRPCIWMTEDIKNLMNDRDNILRKARKSNSETDWKNYKVLRNRCNIMVRNAKASYTKNLINEKRHNPKDFWKSVKEVFPTKMKHNATVNDESYNRNKANKFGFFFSTIVRKIKTSAFKLTDCVWRCRMPMPPRTEKKFRFEYISIIFVKSFLRKLKRKKATGMDDLPAGMLKDSADNITKPLHYIVNLSLKTSTVPNAWKEAKVTPVYKSGDTSSVENYRPISVLPILSKLLEKAVRIQLTKFLESNNLLNDFQYGYREKRSTDLATASFIDDIRKNGDNGKLTGAIFLDLSKAFDTINHDLIIKKLASHGVLNIELKWFADYLFCRSQTVVVGNQYSAKSNVVCGVPQGSILGPLIFLIFFNDFPDHLSKTKCIQYADDTVIYFSSSDIDEIEHTLNNEINFLKKYFDINELILNLKIGKTESMLFGTAKRIGDKSLKIVLDNHEINHTTTYCYLGNELDPTLTMANNFDKSYKKASGRLSLLSKMRLFLNAEAASKIYEMVIVPILLYSTLIHLNITETQRRKFSSIERRAKNIIGGDVYSIEKMRKKKSCNVVKKCLVGELCTPFNDYFVINEHVKSTRNRNLFLKLPSVKLEFGKKSFFYQGAKIYNDLPIAIRSADKNFKNLLFEHFK